MALGSSSTSKTRKRRRLIIMTIFVMVAALLAAMTAITSMQTRKIRQTMNDSAYSSMESTLQSLSGMVSNTFALDQRYLQVLASSMAAADDPLEWINTVDYRIEKVEGFFYADKDAAVAVGKDGAELDLSQYTFSAHGDDQVRSNAFLTSYGSYSYLGRADVKKDGETVGYLYAEYPLSRFKRILPQDVMDGNDISLMDSATLEYVYVPAVSSASMFINYQQLRYYLADASQATDIVNEINQAIRNHQYYMRILRLSNVKDHALADMDYVVYLWPVDDGEYYISGFTKVEFLQGERISVERTVSTMVALLTGVCGLAALLIMLFFGNMAIANKKNAVLQEKHNEELDAALQIAKAANESKSNFLSNMSHDIRTPMNAIIGYNTLISKDSEYPEKVQEYTKKISSASDYLLGLINEVLDMSKIESGKTTLHISQFNIRQLVNEVDSIIRMQTDANQQSFTISVDNVAHEWVMGDEVRIRQIILNLLSNALKYTPMGGKINFSVQGILQTKANMQKLHIVVQDTGYGMDADYVKTIFDPFIRLNNSMTGKIQGTGLGLAITKNIVDLMGGTITVSSVLHKGSTFTVELTLAVAESDEIALSAADADTDNIPFTLEGLHILAAEDNELNAEILTELLAIEGVSCKVCEDGEKVVAEFEHSQPGDYDLILMDIQMPHMNGYEATRAIRAGSHPEAKTIPIVAMTANAFAEDVMDALQAGMDGHISKPVDMTAMKKTLSKVLKNRKEG